jgi:hypothetical protein
MIRRPASIAAALAWVLWSSFESVTTDPTEKAILTRWRSLSTHENKDACEASAKMMLRQWDEGREETRATKLLMRCLPDTEGMPR